MKLKDITEWSERWSTPLGTMDVPPTVADGVLVGLSLGNFDHKILSWSVQREDISAPSGRQLKFTTRYLSF
jgi:hypothetical protein